MNSPGIYIHIPFCKRRCHYCDFYLITNTKVIDKYLDSLIREIEILGDIYNKDIFNSVFIGGGTPSVLNPRQLEIILNSLNKHFKISSHSEISIESNPEDFLGNEKKILEYHRLGINRLSSGIQSFVDSELKFLTRQHSAQDAESVLNSVKKYFDNVSIDIIYSLPSQKKSDLKISLDKICALEIPHISAYTLIFEEGTILYRDFEMNKISPNPNNVESDLYFYLSDFLNQNGYSHYEISNYAKEGYESVHNKKYWNYENYLGLGPGSHSLFNGIRWNNFRNIVKYNSSLQKLILPTENEFKLSSEEMNEEFIMLGLRSSGVDFVKYEKLFNIDFKEKYQKEIKLLTEKGYGIIKNNFFKLTEKGYAILDEICAKYF